MHKREGQILPFSLPIWSRKRQGLTLDSLDSLKGSVGKFYWTGTHLWVDPKEERVGVYMMQSVKHLLWYATMFKKLVVQAVVE